MTSYMRDKLAGHCQHCTATATDGQYCDEHADRQRDYNRRCAAQRRELRRDNGLCAECGVPSEPYRCADCQRRRRPSEDLQPLAR